MNLKYLIKNLAFVRAHCKSVISGIKYLILSYLTETIFRSIFHKFIIGFRFDIFKDNLKLELRNNKGSDLFIFSEIFIKNSYDLDLNIVPENILDLGANIGLTTVYFAKKFPDSNFACVEPIEDNIRQLQRNIELNGINAHIFKGAVAIEDGEVEMELGEKDYAHRIAGFKDTDIGFGNFKKRTVKAFSIETILKNLNWDRINLLKIDIEGYEQELLSKSNEWLRSIDLIMLEVHSNFKLNDLLKIAEQYNFDVQQSISGIWILIKK
jgi:FkbM family methyltransferase